MLSTGDMYIVFEKSTGAIVSAIDGSDAAEGWQLNNLISLSESGGMALAAMDAGASLADMSKSYVSDFTLDPNTDTVALSVTIATRTPLDPAWTADPTAPFTLNMENGNLPAGTTIVARNSADEAVTTNDPLDPIVLAEAGTYEIMIIPPLPQVSIIMKMEVA